MKARKFERRLRWKGGYALPLVAVLAMLFAGQVEAAPIQWTVGSGGNDHWYELKTAALTWTSAKTAAEGLFFLGAQGHLATIASAAENTFLVTNGLANPNPWIGYNDFASEGVFVWVTGEAVTYTNWSGGEPNDTGGIEDGTQIYSTGLWNDLFNFSSAQYIVEFEPVTVPEPSTLLLLGTGLVGLVGYGRRKRKA